MIGPTPDHRALLGRRLPRPLRQFLATESASGVLLIAATAVALIWVNSPWSASYSTLWSSAITIQLGPWVFTEHLGAFVNEGLMALFFFMVSIEIKREFVAGDLHQWRTASLPVIAAAGGVVAPALIYIAFNLGQSGQRGWGIPMATDIAFAVGVLTLLGNRVPASLKLFLLTLAVVDDLVAIVVICVFYSGGLTYPPLLLALLLLGAIAGLRAARVTWWPAFVALGIAVWFAINASGASATLAGVALAFLVPAHPRAEREVVRDWQLDLSEDLSAGDVRTLHRFTRSTVSTAERTIHALHPTVSFVIVPLFALANAGVALSSDLFGSPVAARVGVGVVAGLVVGKLAGITLAARVAVRIGVAELPKDSTWRQFAGVAAISGIGFTVSLFIADLAFTDAALVGAAKVAILGASVVAAALGALILLTARKTS